MVLATLRARDTAASAGLRVHPASLSGVPRSAKPNADLKLGVSVPPWCARPRCAHLALGGPLTGGRAVSRSLRPRALLRPARSVGQPGRLSVLWLRHGAPLAGEARSHLRAD